MESDKTQRAALALSNAMDGKKVLSELPNKLDDRQWNDRLGQVDNDAIKSANDDLRNEVK
jgi:hypothetical protein